MTPPKFLVACVAAAATQAFADTPSTALDPSWRSVQLHESHVIAVDGSDVATFTVANRVLKESALDDLKHFSLSVSKSAQALTVLEAYTRKPDGRRISVPKSNYQLRVDSGRGNGNPAFSDLNETSVVFPDAAVGDTVFIRYRIATKEPLFPGKVSLVGSFARSRAYDDVRVTIDAPEGLPAKFAARGMEQKVSKKKGRSVVEWSLHNPAPVKNERVDFSVYDVESEPGYMYSSFDSYADIARSYVQRAEPKAIPTSRVKALAEQLTQGKEGPREQARALYEWVALNITYAGNCVGIGAVVPRDLDVVLDNKMGDCKDHATLLQALLAAKGIDSQQALVNAGSIFRLPAIPVASLVNHVINYVPSLNLFMDSTDGGTPFGMVPMQLQDKPVLLARPDGMPQRVPADPLGTNEQVSKTTMAILADGSVEGQMEVRDKGWYGVQTRRRFKGMSKDAEANLVKAYFRGNGMEGDGTFVRDPEDALIDRYQFQAKFRVKGVVSFPGSGAFHVSSPFYNEAPVWGWAQQASMPVDDADSVCSSGSSVEEFEITLPEQMQVLSVPDSVSVDAPLIKYEASYRLDGHVLKVRRALVDRTPGNICSAKTMRQFKDELAPVLKNLRQQVLYK